MIHSNNQNEPFSLSKFNNENILSQSSTDVGNKFISDNTSTIKNDFIQSNSISFMSKNNREEDFPSEIFNENNLRDDTTVKDRMKIYYIYKKNFMVEKKSTIKGSKRGRKNCKKNINRKKKTHDKNSSDNFLRKIQNNYLTFIISFMNEIFEYFNIKQKLRNLDYKFKSTVNKEHVKYLKSANIRDIICHDISNKYKRKRDINNKSICNAIKNEVLEKILAENYLILFRKFYYNGSNKINLKEYGLDKDIILSNKVKLFKDNQKLYSIDEYKFNIDQFVKKHFFISLFNVPNKKSIE